MKTLCTIVIMALEVLEMVRLLPSTSKLASENSVSEPSLPVLTQVMLGKGRPSAVQLRESGAPLRSWTLLTGSSIMEGATE